MSAELILTDPDGTRWLQLDMFATLVARKLLGLDDSQVVCMACEGGGQVPLGVHYVTHDMAIDAGQPELEGQEIVEYGRCQDCGGEGYVWV